MVRASYPNLSIQTPTYTCILQIYRTFQEYLLSPRTLLLGHKNLMYQCTQFFYDELLGPLSSNPNPSLTTSTTTTTTPAVPDLSTDLCKSKYFPASLFHLSKPSSSDPSAPSLLSFLRNWLTLINEYRARNLSFKTDRIIAIAGIARAFAHLGNLTYLAGLWKECLPLTLLWYISHKSSLLARAHNGIPAGKLFDYTVQVQEAVDAPEAIPTWSFFRSPVYAFHHLALLFGDDEASAKRKSMVDTAGVCFDNVFWAGLVAFRWKGLPENQVSGSVYSDFAGLRLTLSTTMLLLTSCAWSTDVLPQMHCIRRKSLCAADRQFECSPIFKYHSDDIIGSDGGPPNNSILALVADVQIVRAAGKYAVQRYLMGLVVSPGVERNTWMRVGAWKLQLRISGVEVTSETVSLVAQRWRGYEVLSKEWADRVINLV
jgi:hypothetical protein